MCKYLVLVQTRNDRNRLEKMLDERWISFKRHGETMYDVWAMEGQVDYLRQYDWIACIKVG